MLTHKDIFVFFIKIKIITNMGLFFFNMYGWAASPLLWFCKTLCIGMPRKNNRHSKAETYYFTMFANSFFCAKIRCLLHSKCPNFGQGVQTSRTLLAHLYARVKWNNYTIQNDLGKLEESLENLKVVTNVERSAVPVPDFSVPPPGSRLYYQALHQFITSFSHDG